MSLIGFIGFIAGETFKSYYPMNASKLFLFFLLFTYNVSGQSTSTKSETPLIEKEMFINGEIPNDFPPREDYKSDSIYKKVIQGYINVYTDNINKPYVIKKGYTVPESNGLDEKSTLDNRRKRKKPVLKEQEKIEKQN